MSSGQKLVLGDEKIEFSDTQEGTIRDLSLYCSEEIQERTTELYREMESCGDVDWPCDGDATSVILDACDSNAR